MYIRKLIAIFFTAISLSANAMMPDFFSETSSPNADRGATSLAPNEIIDTFSGSLSINHTDLVIPGNGGMDIRIQRSYSPNNVYLRPDNQPNRFNRLVETSPYGLGWSMHFGRLRLTFNGFLNGRLTGICGNTTINNPVLEMPDGSQRQLFCNDFPNRYSTSAEFITKDHWSVSLIRASSGALIGFEVINPEGIKYTMDYRIVGGRARRTEQVWYTSRITDRNGNFISIEYDSKSALESPIFKRVSGSDGRQVTFSYVNNTSPGRVKLSQIRSGNRTLSYTFRAFQPDYTILDDSEYHLLTRVSLPGGNSTGHWGYTYHQKSVGQPGDNALQTITYPMGATTTYDYQYVCILFNNCSTTGQFISLVTKSKINAGRGIARGTWIFNYSVSRDEKYNIVEIVGPNSKEQYQHFKVAIRVNLNQSYFGQTLNLWRAGLLDKKTTSSLNNIVLQVENYQYDKRVISSEPYERTPYTFDLISANDPNTYQHYLTQRSITRDGTTYTTQYENFSDNINPHRIVETGQESKTTNLTYYPRRTNQNIVSQVQNERVAAGNNRAVTRSFDLRGNLTSEVRYGVITQYSYDSQGNVSSAQDARGNTTSYSNYNLGVARTERRPEGVTIIRTVDNFGNTESMRDGRGNTTRYSYDALNRLTSIVKPRGANIAISWTTQRRTLTRGRHRQVKRFDGLGRTICQDMAGVFIGMSYSAVGNRLHETYPNYGSCSNSPRTEFSYDGLNRAIRTKYPDTSSQTISYLSNNRQSLKDERGQTFVSSYRSFGSPDAQELIGVTGPNSLNYQVTRNILGQVSLIQRDGINRSFDFGSSIFLQNETNPETGRTVYTRDANGNMRSKKVGASPVTAYAYDNLNRLKTVNYPGATPDVSRTYDRSNNVIRINSGIADLKYSYDENNNLRREEQTLLGDTYFINYTYDDLDFLQSVTNPDNSLISYAPNALGWPTSAAPYVTDVSYNASGQPLSIRYQNGRTSTHTYQARLWPDRTTVNGGVSNRLRSYDNGGNLLSINDTLDNQFDRTMTYDGLNRLRAANGGWGAGEITYAAGDNIKAKRMGNTRLNYTYRTNVQQINSISGLDGFSSTANYEYDVYGNIRRKANNTQGWLYEYDDASNLRTVLDTSNTTLRNYDYSGLRQRVRSVKSDETRIYVVNQQGQIVRERVTEGDKPNITNVYLGNRLVAELEQASGGTPDVVDGPGFGGGNDDDAVVVTQSFVIEEAVESFEYCVDGFGINIVNEVSVAINGTRVGFLRAGRNGTTTCFNVPPGLLNIGTNTATFTQQNSDGTWGVSNFVLNIEYLFSASSVLPAILLLLDDETSKGGAR